METWQNQVWEIEIHAEKEVAEAVILKMMEDTHIGIGASMDATAEGLNKVRLDYSEDYSFPIADFKKLYYEALDENGVDMAVLVGYTEEVWIKNSVEEDEE